MNTKDRGEVFVPQGPMFGGAFYHLRHEPRVIVVRGPKDKYVRLHVTEACANHLGYPQSVVVYVKRNPNRGHTITITPANGDETKMYKLYSRYHRTNESDHAKGCASLNLNALVKTLDIEKGIYTARLEEDGDVVFDTSQRPRKI